MFNPNYDNGAGFIIGWIGKEGLLVKDDSTLIPSEPFVIFEEGSAKPLQVEILHDSPYTHLYRVVDKTLKACILHASENGNNPECKRKAIANFRDGTNLQRLVKQGKVEDVSAAFFYSLKSAWVRPKSGFKEGKTYIFKYLGLGNYQPYVSQRRELRVVIGPAIDPQLLADTKLTLAGDKRIEEIHPVHGQNSHLFSYQSMAQFIEYELPLELEPYRNILAYSTSHQIESSPVQAPGASGIHYIQCVDCDWPSVGFERGKSMVEFLSRCTARSNAEPQIQIGGKVRFPELSDKEYETPKIALQFQNEEGRACYGLEFFKRAIASRYYIFIEKMVCDLAEGVIGDLNVKGYLPSLTELTRSEDQKIKSCSARALQKMSAQADLGAVHK